MNDKAIVKMVEENRTKRSSFDEYMKKYCSSETLEELRLTNPKEYERRVIYIVECNL
jgi:hypothetical protein